MCGFDTHFADVMAHPDGAHTDRSSLRLGLLPAGMASSEPVAPGAMAAVPHRQRLGMTEAGVGVSLGFPTDTEDDRCLASGTALLAMSSKSLPQRLAPPPAGHPG